MQSSQGHLRQQSCQGRLPGERGSRAEAAGRGVACRAVGGDKGKLGRGQHRHISGNREDFRMVEAGRVTSDEAAESRGHTLLTLELLGSVPPARKHSVSRATSQMLGAIEGALLQRGRG